MHLFSAICRKQRDVVSSSSSSSGGGGGGGGALRVARDDGESASS